MNSKAKAKTRYKKKHEREIFNGKDKHVLKIVGQPFIKLIWRLKDKGSKIIYINNN